MKNWFLAGLLVGACSLAIGQSFDNDDYQLHVKCHTYEMQEAFFQANPTAKEQAASFAAQLEAFTRNFSETDRDGDPYIIPVVFHIVHNNGIENISNAQVEDCIRVMNEDFSASNPTINSVNDAFQDLIADVGVEFRLAQRDPDGNCTNGIIRTVSGLTSEGGENLKAISPIWDRSSYMNVWVCGTIASGAAGYTYYPSSLAGSFGLTNDGIVVRNDYVGSIGTSSPQRSHVLTHEVGHWINLAHLWGSTNQPEEESNCDSDDGVTDTPNTIGWTTCNINGESCGSLDNVENFMEYAYCSKMFTEGQKVRMIAALNSSVASRSSLWQEENLIATGVLDEPILCRADFSSSERDICAGESITFQDMSYNSVLSRTWIFEGGTPPASYEENPTVTYEQPGLYSVGLLVSDGNSSDTEVKTSFVRVLGQGFSSIPFTEGFENPTALDGQSDNVWYIEENPDGADWEVTSQTSYNGDRSAMVRGFLNDGLMDANLYSQTFDLSEVSNNAVLTFKYAYARRNSGSNDRLRVWISRNCGDFWSLRKTIQGDDLPTVSEDVNIEFVPTSQSEWEEVSINNIVSVFLNPEFRVRFDFRSSNGNNVYIDDINLEDAAFVTDVEVAAENSSGLSVYPVPAANEIRVEFSTEGLSENATITIYDLTGRVVDNLNLGVLPSGVHLVERSISSLAAGVYLLSLQTGTNAAMSRRIVKQ